MALWKDIADWIGPTVNETPSAMGNIVGVVLHIQDGYEQGTIAWQHNPTAQVSSHFLAPKTGRAAQMVDTADKAWAEAAGNSHWLSIENEGFTGDSLTANQLEACAQILAKAHQVYGVPLQATDDPNGSGLGVHSMGGNAWGGHFDCPGSPIKNQRPAIVARANQIVNGGDVMQWSDPNSAKVVDGRTPDMLLIDIWSGEQRRDSAFVPGVMTARQTRLTEIQDALAKLQALVSSLQVSSQPLKAGDKVGLTVDSVNGK